MKQQHLYNKIIFILKTFTETIDLIFRGLQRYQNMNICLFVLRFT